MDNNEIPKYRKKKPSKSKSASKSDHKHQYNDCLLVDEENRPHKAEYCIICGKINNVKAFETERIDGGRFRMLTYDEVFQKYKGLKQFQVKDMWDKKVEFIMTERTIDLIDTYCVNCEYAKNDMENEPCYSCIEGYNNNLVVGFYTKRTNTDEEN